VKGWYRQHVTRLQLLLYTPRVNHRPDTTGDKIAMLLSVDWFFPLWRVVGLQAAEHNKRCFQQGCREIVTQMMAKADSYYCISFADGRVRSTREAVLALATKCGFDRATSQRLHDLCCERSERERQEKTAWLFKVMLDRLAVDNELPASVVTVLESTKSAFSLDEDLGQLCAGSASQWDNHIRQLTSDLPTSLADWISVAVLPEAVLEYTLGVLNADEQKLLLNRFRAIAKIVTGLDEAELPQSWR
jgi:hypothetical protein